MNMMEALTAHELPSVGQKHITLFKKNPELEGALRNIFKSRDGDVLAKFLASEARFMSSSSDPADLVTGEPVSVSLAIEGAARYTTEDDKARTEGKRDLFYDLIALTSLAFNPGILEEKTDAT